MKRYSCRISLILCLLLALSILLAGGANATAVSADKAAACLKDGWKVHVDSNNTGEQDRWFAGFPDGGTAVSLPYESSDVAYTDVVWFSNQFFADLDLEEGQRAVLDFEGVQYYTKAWLNGAYLGDHEGAYGRFQFDVTDHLRHGEQNLLALRLYVPRGSSTHRGATAASLPQWLGAFQRIQTPVYLRAVPDVSISDTYAAADYQTGNVEVTLTLHNPTDEIVRVDIASEITVSGVSGVLDSDEKTVKVWPGTSAHTLSLQVSDFTAWSPDNPYLYDVNATARAKGAAFIDSSCVTTGFKDLRVDGEGYFVLNGERLFLKSAHTAPYVLGSVDVGADTARQFHQLDYLKSAGFDMVRFISGPALPEMLDYCDRIGLMVYEETAMAWFPTDCSITGELMSSEISQLLYRDRNHVSFSILGLLNETYGTGATQARYAAAVSSLGPVRDIDDDVLVPLSSGRWDNRRETASACNPGSRTWDGWMGNEGNVTSANPAYMSLFSGMGDIHYYPNMPYDAAVRDAFAAIGDVRAAFVSEAGAGSQPNIISDYRTLQQEDNLSLGNLMNQSIAQQLEALDYIYSEYGFDSVFATQEDIITQSQLLQARQRALLVDYIRSNPKISGYSMTQGADIGYRGEGVLEGNMTHKAAMFDAMRDCWSDLRWCVNLDEYNVYSDETLDVDIRLSNFGVLENRDYTAVIRITGETGTMYKQTATVRPTFDAAGNAAFSVPVLNASIPMTDFETGEYTISATLYGEEAAAGSKTFWVTRRSDLPQLTGTVYQYGLSAAEIATLTARGATVAALDPDHIPAGCTILLGQNNTSAEVLNKLYENVRLTGSHLAGTSYGVFGDSGQTRLPFAQPGTASVLSNWLYHSDAVVYDTPITSGLQTQCLVDPTYYEAVYDPHCYGAISKPDELHAFAFFIGNDGGVTEQDLYYGVSCGTYCYGEGYITVNTFDIPGGAGTPVADRLLLNMAAYLDLKAEA